MLEFTEDGRVGSSTLDFGPVSTYSVQGDQISFGDRSGTFSVEGDELRIDAFARTRDGGSGRVYWCVLSRA